MKGASNMRKPFSELLTSIKRAITQAKRVPDRVDQDERTPQVLFHVADLLIQWYGPLGVRPEDMPECITEDLRVAIEDLLANRG